MEEGSLRCDANVSVRPVGRDGASASRPSSRTSTRSATCSARSSSRSSARQACSRRRTTLVQETRLWDPAAEPHDGRCGPRKRRTTTATSPSPTCRRSSLDAGLDRGDPRARCPSCRRRGAAASSQQYELPEYDAGVLTQSMALADYFERVAAGARQPEGGQQLGDGGADAQAERARRRSIEAAPLAPGRARRAHRAHRQGHDQRTDRQGRVREDVRTRPARRRRSSRPKGWRRSTTPARSTRSSPTCSRRIPDPCRVPRRARRRPSASSSAR